MLRRRLVKAVAAVVIVTAVGPNPGFAFQVPAPPRDTPAPTRAEGRITPRPAQARRAAGQGMLDLEDAIARAELVLAVRLVDMTEAKIVHGGKTEVITQQFRFEPVRTLKGIFARDSLLLTGQDLGIYQFGEAADRLGAGRCCSSCWDGRDRATSTATPPARSISRSPASGIRPIRCWPPSNR